MTAAKANYPEAMTIADELSLRAQRRFLISTRIQLSLLVIASSIGVISWNAGFVDLAALVAGIGLAIAALVRLWLSRTEPHTQWYEGRAAAESLKSLAWRYAVGGHPFSMDRANIDEALAERSADVIGGFDSLPSTARIVQASSATAWMRSARQLDLERRRAAYRSGRIIDQQHWYRTKASWNKRRANLWQGAVFALLLGSAVGAFLKAFDIINFDLFGLAGAAVGSAAAWLETRQHSALAAAYRVAAEELIDIEKLLDGARDEESWANLVGEAEAAISREHMTWKANSSDRRPASLA